jgi:hypothetical protein
MLAFSFVDNIVALRRKEVDRYPSGPCFPYTTVYTTSVGILEELPE